VQQYPVKIAMMCYSPGQLFCSPGQQITPQRASNELPAKLGAELGVAALDKAMRGVTRPAPAGIPSFSERDRVERSLYQRGIGYNYEATKIFMPAGSKQPVVVHYLEHVPADVGAAFIWLKNRDPDRWRDVQNVEHVMGKYIISDRPMTMEQWAAERATVINEVIDDTKELPAPADATHVKSR
jgi:hypothetical protein